MLSSNILFIPTQFFFSPAPFRLHRFHSILQGAKLIHGTCRIIIKVTSKVNLWYHIQYIPVQWCTFFFLYWGSFTSWTISVEVETETPAPCFVCLLPMLSSFLHSGDYPKSPYSCVQKFEHLGEGPLTEFVLLQKLYFGLHCRCGSRKDGHFKEKKLQKNYFFNNKDACHQSIFFLLRRQTPQDHQLAMAVMKFP